MASKRAKAKEKAYVEIDLKLLRETGEVKIISEPIICPEISIKLPRGKFEITYTAELLGLMEELGNKKINVLTWLLDHKDGNNCINTSVRDIAKKLKVSPTTVQGTMKVLKEAGLLTQQGSVYMISPHLIVKGSQAREAYLMRKYVDMEGSNIVEFPESEAM